MKTHELSHLEDDDYVTWVSNGHSKVNDITKGLIYILI